MLFSMKDCHSNFVQVATTDRRVMSALIGLGVIFATLGLGEAVYRVLFRDFDGATDRLPIEVLFGLSFAFAATKLVGKIYRYYQRTSSKMKFIRDRNRKIRRAVEALAPAPYAHNQQAIRVIREQVDRIDCELSDATTY